MSWSASGTAVVRTPAVDESKGGNDGPHATLEMTHRQTQTGHGAEESEKALTAAETAARTVLESGVCGEGTFNVSMSGHCNPGNRPAVGWSNEFFSLSITQQRGPA